MVDVDTTGAGVLRQAIGLLKKRNITFAVSRADRSLRSWLERYDLMELITPGRFYPTNRHAAQAFRQYQDGATTEHDAGAADKRDEGGAPRST
jgi:STAS domain.